MEKIVIATSSKSKLKELESLFKDYSFETCADLGLKIERPEDGSSYQENSLIKATEIYEKSLRITLADDSGIEIVALNNLPGLYSSRYLAPLPFRDRCQIMLDELKDKEDRTAYFKCALTLIDRDGLKYSVLGVVKGSISYEIRGDNGFGYDPIFIPDGFNKTYAEMSDEEKDQISHRATAAKLLIEKLPTKLKRRLSNA